MKKKVIVAGHICVDITPKFLTKKQTDISQLLLPGKLLQMGDVEIHTGGAVANTGLAMKILGADVTLMGKTGQDAFGDIVAGVLRKYDAADGLIRMEKESTSYTIVLAVPGIDRIFLHNPGANNTFCADDLPAEALEKADLLHFGYPQIMRSMYVDDGAELIRLLKKVRDAGCAVSLDMAAVDEESDAGKADWDSILRKALPYVDFFVPSVEELCYILDYPRFMEWQERAAGCDITEILDIEKDVRPLADKCMEYGAKVLLIKCGAPGIYYRTAGADVLSGISQRAGLDIEAWKEQEGFEKSYVPERILSGTGAGDTSIAAFLTAMLDGRMPEECMHLAAATGASCVAAYDALSGLKSFEELQKKIDAGWKKNG